MGADKDIVERLSALEAQEGICGQSDVRRLAFRDARAEIVRLRGELDTAKSAYVDLLSNAMQAGLAAAPAPAMPNGVEGLGELLDLAPRAAELADRLVMSGPKAAHVSASETHEIAEFVHAAIDALRAADNRDVAGVPAGEAVATVCAAARARFGPAAHPHAVADWIEEQFRATPPAAPVQAAAQEGEAVDTLALRMLVAAGHVSQKLMDQSRSIARGVLPGPLDAANHPACELGAVRELPTEWRASGQPWSGYYADELDAALQHRGDSRGGEG